MAANAQANRQGRSSAVPTLHDVAAHAGVSTMTVSRVLGGGKNVRPAKMESVLASIEALGYRKNENARSLRPGQRTGLIGVIITNVANPYYAEVQLGIEETLAAHNLRLLVGNSGEDAQRERQLTADFVGRQVDGLIVVPSGGATEHLTEKFLGSTPLVLATRELEGFEADTVLIDDINGAYLGTKKLIAEGHKRIAFVGNTSLFTGKRRFEGFVKAHRESGLEVNPDLVKSGQHNTTTAQQAIEELLSMEEAPTAVFSANNRSTIGILRGAAATASSKTLRVVGFDNFELSDMMPFALTVIDHDARELGRQAGKLLLHRLEHEDDDSEVRHIQLPTRLLG
ncbi:LacI family DNA-binding transcriptional regulator [Arthrobacter sp. B2a2-09]|uniref:LacI family DNA-binding transcriptional regulator n=1 Tax=Arthrobacter sp. B2a2-09 TaxID=2952822 RepID=UPI0022CDB718|nr:LacI family DNA-binding transcriptional regulator [Arthrobacter sp. B2a2-09]MCZ9883661.1 LacI family transcriptional regulator [Arthrobacter sp. B2a2-09]